jgi:hypothetical protein
VAPLPPRASLPLPAIPVLTGAILAALFFVLAAFRTREAERGLVAQAAAVASGIAVVTAAATIATSMGKDRQAAGGRRFTGVVIRSLMLLVVIAIGGALYILFRT